MKFRKKPVVIEATQWFKSGDHEAVVECYFEPNGHIRWSPGLPQEINIHGCHKMPGIRTLEGWHAVSSGDWIITGIKGEFYPCKEDIFEQTYEQVD